MIKDLKALSVVVVAFVLMFVPSLAAGYYPIVADSFCYSYPLRTAAFNMLRNGEWPLWTHEILSGYPLLSMAQIGVGYPLTWTYFFLPGHWAETVYVLAPYLLAPAFMYAYCREVGRTQMASLLAGLSLGYAGFMFSKYTSSGMFGNATMWLPLVLLALERLRRTYFLKCLIGATAAFALAVLTGIGQGFVFAGLVAICYALFVCLVQPNRDAHASLTSWRRWTPLLVIISAVLLAAGVAAFQIFETAQASDLSIRRKLSYATFGEGSLTPVTVWRSLLLPFYAFEFIDVAAFISPLVLLLAMAGFVRFSRRSQRDSRVFFWAGLALVSLVLMLGINTPLYQLIYEVPILNRFRVPARHTFEWSFALSILGAYGWDAITAAANSRIRWVSRKRLASLTSITLVLLVCAIAIWWSQAVGRPESPSPIHYAHLPQSSYLIFKAVHTAILILSIIICIHSHAVIRSVLFGATIVLACLTEPYILFKSWWLPQHKTVSEFSTSTPSLATGFLQQFSPEQNRVYTRVNLFHESPRMLEKIDTHNVSLLHGLHNVAGYETFMIERYSRLLGNVGVDSVNPRPGLLPDHSIYSARSQVLDLLNVTFVVGYANLSTTLAGGGTKKGIEFPANDLGVNLKPREKIMLRGLDLSGDTLAVVSSLSNSVAVANGSVVARLTVMTQNGLQELSLVAGRDTAEWAHERMDVRTAIKHQLAPVFDGVPGDDDNSFTANRYWTTLPLGQTRGIEWIEIENLDPTASVAIWKAVLHDRSNQSAFPLLPDNDLFRFIQDDTRWQRIFNQNGVLILKNLRSNGRAWFVSRAESVAPEEALRRVRGEADTAFDPFKEALLEVSPAQLPKLDPEVSRAHVIKLTYKPNAVEVITESDGRSLLVVSEVNYPGWSATVDGNPSNLYTTDYILQGVAVPPGRHVVELRYTAPAARKGAIVSIVTVLLLAGLFVRTLWPRFRNKAGRVLSLSSLLIYFRGN